MLIRMMACFVVVWSKQLTVREPFIKKYGCRNVELLLLLLFPCCLTEVYIERLWTNVELGRHRKMAIAYFL